LGKGGECMGSKKEKLTEFVKALSEKGVSRREFLTYCSTMAAVLGLPAGYGAKIAEALESPQKPTVVWLEMLGCTGDTESLLRASKPTVGELILDIISLEYHETIMAPSGHQAEKSLNDVVKNLKGKYICIVEGAIPLKHGGIHLTIGGRPGVDIAREVCGNAMATIAVGNCAWDGGLPAAQPNPTGSVGVKEAVPGATVISLPGCPMNVENLTATIVHFLTFGSLPATDSMGRPLFAYGKRIHDNCERRGHFDAGQFVASWGDEGHRKGWCLYEMGCKGPGTYHNCPTVKWNDGTSWPVQSGHGCIGCAAPHFWDTMTPFYDRLPGVSAFGIEGTADKVGKTIAGVTAVGLAAHALGRAVSDTSSKDKGE
jgi:hydrogenase small subunit